MQLWRDPTQSWDQADEEYRRDVRACWQAGNLSYKLDPSQLEVYHLIWKGLRGVATSAEREFLLDISRRWGKSTVMCVIAVEVALLHANGRIPYMAPTREMVKELLTPIMRWVLQDCPPELRPQTNKSENVWTFVNGARIKMVGCDQNPDAGRGPSAVAAFVDEAGFIRRLEYVIEEVLRPQLMTEPDSFLLLASTPPETPGHAWSLEYVPAAKARGLYVHRTIEDNPRITPEEREAYIRKAGGRTSTRCRRELFAEHVIEEDLALIPEFQAVKGAVVCERERPRYVHCYAAFDWGWTDLCVGLFGYWDFKRQVAYIERDFSARHANTKEAAEIIQGIERDLWKDLFTPEGKPQPFLRFGDESDPRMIHELGKEYAVRVVPVPNKDLHNRLAETRVDVAEGRVEIHPRCTTLIAHLEHGIWNPAKTEFARTDRHGHFDAISTLCYFVRNVSRGRNPYPVFSQDVKGDTHFVNPLADTVQAEKRKLRDAFRSGRSRR